MPTHSTPGDDKTRPTRLYRSEKNRVIAGVAGGLGEFFGIDPTIVRVVFVLFTLLWGGGILLYFILWVIIPTESSVKKDSLEARVQQNVREMQDKAEKFAQGFEKNARSRYWLGIILVGLGFLILLGNFSVIRLADIGRLWPLLLIALGFAVLVRRYR
jgi:phage shock protein C